MQSNVPTKENRFSATLEFSKEGNAKAYKGLAQQIAQLETVRNNTPSGVPVCAPNVHVTLKGLLADLRGAQRACIEADHKGKVWGS